MNFHDHILEHQQHHICEFNMVTLYSEHISKKIYVASDWTKSTPLGVTSQKQCSDSTPPPYRPRIVIFLPTRFLAVLVWAETTDLDEFYLKSSVKLWFFFKEVKLRWTTLHGDPQPYKPCQHHLSSVYRIRSTSQKKAWSENTINIEHWLNVHHKTGLILWHHIE